MKLISAQTLFIVFAFGQLTSAAVNPTELNRIKMMNSNQVRVVESLVEVRGQKYHSVEYQGLLFYFLPAGIAKQPQSHLAFCKQYTVAGLDKIPHRTFDTRMTRLAQTFLETLKGRCQKVDRFTDLGLITPKSQRIYSIYEDLLSFKSDF